MNARDMLVRLIVVLAVSLLVNGVLVWRTARGYARPMVITRCTKCGLETPPSPAPQPKEMPAALPLPEIRSKVDDLLKRPDAVDLLRIIDPTQDTIHGFWVTERREVIGLRAKTIDQPGRLQIPYVPPPEYDLVLQLVRRSGSDGVIVGLASEYGSFNLVLDRYPAEGFKSGLELIDGQDVRNNPTTRSGLFLPVDAPVQLLCTVRKGRVTALLNDQLIVDWREQSPRLGQNPVSGVREPRALALGCWDSRIQFKRIVLIPAGGVGKMLR